MILKNETVPFPKFISAHKLLEDRFLLELSNKDNKKGIKKIELTIGDHVCLVKYHQDLICDTIVKGLLSKRYGGLESPSVFVLVADNKLDFYKIVEIADKKYQINLDRVLTHTIVKRFFTIYQLADFLINDLKTDIKKKYKSKLVIITGDFFLSDLQITKDEKDWLYPQMIRAIKNITDSIILIFSPITLSNLINYENNNCNKKNV